MYILFFPANFTWGRKVKSDKIPKSPTYAAKFFFVLTNPHLFKSSVFF